MNKQQEQKYPLKLDIQYFSDEKPDSNEDDKDTSKDKDNEKILSQVEVDAILTKRLAREREKVSDYDSIKEELKALQDAQKERDRNELSEIDRLKAEMEDRDKKELTLTKELEKVRTQAKEERIRNEFIRVATTSNVEYIDAALKLVDLSKVTTDEDGKITGIKDIVSTLVEDNPFLVKAKVKPKNIGSGTGAEEQNDKSKDQLIADATEKARESGRIEDRVALAQLRRELA